MSLSDLLRLVRWKVSAAAALTALAGAVAFSARYLLHLPVVSPTLGTLLLAMGASALNQVQERGSDARMERTRDRPIAAGRLGPGLALVVAAFLLAAGVGTLALAGPVPVVLGMAALVWYNGVYTPLKRVTAFAAIPGALVGVIPPAIGWVAAGGVLLDPRLLALALAFLLWQFPHFWLLHARFGPQLERAGLPSLTRRLDPGQTDRIVFAWIVSAGAAPALLPLFGLSARTPALLYPALGAALIGVSAYLLLGSGSRNRAHRLAFAAVNSYFLILVALLSIDRLIRLV